VNEQLSLLRLSWLMQGDFRRSYRSVLVISGTVALVALIVSVMGAYDGVVGDGFYRVLFLAALFSWGTIGTSFCFNDLHGRATNSAFLLLPASALEKTLSRLIVYTIGSFVYLLVFTTVLSWIFEGINLATFEVRRELFSPFDRLVWSLLPHYVVAQGLFFLGAAWFRKAQFVKTVGAVALIVCGLSVVAVGIAWLFGPSAGMRFEGGWENAYRPIEWLIEVSKWAYFVVLPPLCWFVAWLRVTETQVSHGI
jgi:hypothetical protein